MTFSMSDNHPIPALQAHSARESLRICRMLAEFVPAFGQLVPVYEREAERYESAAVGYRVVRPSSGP